MKVLKIISLFVSSLILISCQTSPKRYATVMEGEWTAKVLVRDIQNSKSHIVNIDIKAIQNNALRMDVTTPAGMHVASLAMKDDNLQYVLMREKKFVRGKSKPKALKPLIRVPMDPKILNNIVFDLPIEAKGWRCQMDKSDFLQNCENKESQLKIEWKDRKQTTKLVKVTHPKAELQMKFLTFQSHLSKREKAFDLKIPQKFKVYRIR